MVCLTAAAAAARQEVARRAEAEKAALAAEARRPRGARCSARLVAAGGDATSGTAEVKTLTAGALSTSSLAVPGAMLQPDALGGVRRRDADRRALHRQASVVNGLAASTSERWTYVSGAYRV